VLGGLGLKVITVPEQREGNGDFPTVEKPNPEEAPAMKMAVELGQKEHADVVMATDPDADRFGIAIPASGNPACVFGTDYILISGNQMGCLLEDYILLSRKELGKLPANAAVVSSVVTTGMQKKIAEYYGVKHYDCLTGFKWIADVMNRTQKDGSATVVFGTEESYGYLVEDAIRDKDGVSAAAMTAEMTLYWRSKGKSLLDRLNELYGIVGYWEETQINKYIEGIEGPGKIKAIMEEYRKNPPATMGGLKVVKVRDVLHGAEASYGYKLAPSDLLQFQLEDGTTVSLRPSGTEPKIKFYVSCNVNCKASALDEARSEAGRKLGAIKEDIYKVIGKD
jgi:phosphoglucomutase